MLVMVRFVVFWRGFVFLVLASSSLTLRHPQLLDPGMVVCFLQQRRNKFDKLEENAGTSNGHNVVVEMSDQKSVI